jgi:hypothetical protein
MQYLHLDLDTHVWWVPNSPRPGSPVARSASLLTTPSELAAGPHFVASAPRQKCPPQPKNKFFGPAYVAPALRVSAEPPHWLAPLHAPRRAVDFDSCSAVIASQSDRPLTFTPWCHHND